MEEEDGEGKYEEGEIKKRRRNKRRRKKRERETLLLWVDIMKYMKGQNITNTYRTTTLFPRARTSTISCLWSSKLLPLGPSNLGTWSITSLFWPWISWPWWVFWCRTPHKLIFLTLVLIYAQASYGFSAPVSPRKDNGYGIPKDTNWKRWWKWRGHYVNSIWKIVDDHLRGWKLGFWEHQGQW